MSQNDVYKILKKKGNFLSTMEIAKKLNISKTTCATNINKLMKHTPIEIKQFGYPRKFYYKLNEEMENTKLK